MLPIKTSAKTHTSRNHCKNACFLSIPKSAGFWINALSRTLVRKRTFSPTSKQLGHCYFKGGTPPMPGATQLYARSRFLTFFEKTCGQKKMFPVPCSKANMEFWPSGHLIFCQMARNKCSQYLILKQIQNSGFLAILFL